MKCHKAKVLADSIANNVRLTTFELTYPRVIHGEMMTHRVLSRNTGSSRAIPTQKLINDVVENPYIPTHWGKNQPGMQAEVELDEWDILEAKVKWLQARDKAVQSAYDLMDIGCHKQIVNRLLEPFQWHTAIFSGTDWSNFLNQRCHKDANPEIKAIAELIKEQFKINEPKSTKIHLPLIQDDEWHLDLDILKKISVGRCARVSYLSHDGKRDIEKDIELHDRLLKSGHFSPFEHVASPGQPTIYYANFLGWVQYRKTIPFEWDALGILSNNCDDKNNFPVSF